VLFALAAIVALAAASFQALDGTTTSLAPWQGKVIVLNFWATWCPPCREEIPDLMNIQREFAGNSVQVVGIALDSMENTRRFADELKVNYPLLVAGSEGLVLARDVGNRAGALPFTVVIDKQGNIVKSHLGVLRLDDLRTILKPLVS
jgi:peroxiredoxin